MLELLHLFSLLLLVLLGFYVFVADPRNRANQTFAAFIAFLALWTVKDLVFWNFSYREGLPAGWWIAASFVIALLMQFALVVFAWVFPGNRRTPRKKAAVIFAPGLILIPAAFAGLLWNEASFDGKSFNITLAPLAYAFVIYVYAVFVYGTYVLYRKFLELRGTQEGQQVGAILWGLSITVVLKTMANIVLPYLGNYSLLPYSSTFVLPGVLIYAYAISNFRLFSLQTALDQFRLFPITYKVALSIASVAIISFLIFQVPIVLWAFRDGMDLYAWRKYLVFSVISALVPNLLLVLLIVRSISRPLQRLTVAAVKVRDGEYGTEADLRRSNDEIGLLADSFNQMSRKMLADIRELRKLNEQLIRTEKLAALGTLSAGVAHEVNNPLASISSLIQMIERSGEVDGETLEKLRLIQIQVARISSVTKDMMDFARVRPAARSKVCINEVIRSSLRLAGFDKDFQKLEISAELDPEVPDVDADPDQIQQVFLNLLLNARDAMPEGGRLTVRSGWDGTHVFITIADTGKGIAESELKKIFDPFFTTKTGSRGTGLGLAVCYGIVTAHGGNIDVESSGLGTEFRVRLPVDEIDRKPGDS